MALWVVRFALVAMSVSMPSSKRLEEGNDLADGRGRLKRSSDHALYTSPSPDKVYFQKYHTYNLRCKSWRQGERLSSIFWYRDSTCVAEFYASNEQKKNFTISKRHQVADDLSVLTIYDVINEDRGIYECIVVNMNTTRERRGPKVTVEILVVTNQNWPIITGCELLLPGEECKLNFDPDEDIQINCSVSKVNPKVTLVWEDVSKCDINFQETSFERFHNVTKTFDQYQRLIVKAWNFSTGCKPKFVCKATGVAIPYQPFSAVVIPVKSGDPGAEVEPDKQGNPWMIAFLTVVPVLVLALALLALLVSCHQFWKKPYHHKESPSSVNVIDSQKKVRVTINEDGAEAGPSVPLLEASSETQTSTACHVTSSEIQDDVLQVHIQQSSAPEPSQFSGVNLRGKKRDNTELPSSQSISKDQFEMTDLSTLKREPRDEGDVSAPHETSYIHDDAKENDDQQKSSSEAACEPQHDDLHQTQDPLLGASSETQTSIASVVTSSEIQDGVQDDNQQSSAPEPSQVGLGTISLNLRESDSSPISQFIEDRSVCHSGSTSYPDFAVAKDPPESNYSEPNAMGVGVDSNGREQSDHEGMASVKINNGNEMEDDVNVDVG